MWFEREREREHRAELAQAAVWGPERDPTLPHKCNMHGNMGEIRKSSWSKAMWLATEGASIKKSSPQKPQYNWKQSAGLIWNKSRHYNVLTFISSLLLFDFYLFCPQGPLILFVCSRIHQCACVRLWVQTGRIRFGRLLTQACTQRRTEADSEINATAQTRTDTPLKKRKCLFNFQI